MAYRLVSPHSASPPPSPPPPRTFCPLVSRVRMERTIDEGGAGARGGKCAERELLDYIQQGPLIRAAAGSGNFEPRGRFSSAAHDHGSEKRCGWTRGGREEPHRAARLAGRQRPGERGGVGLMVSPLVDVSASTRNHRATVLSTHLDFGIDAGLCPVVTTPLLRDSVDGNDHDIHEQLVDGRRDSSWNTSVNIFIKRSSRRVH
ncbi:hypothetical protein GGR56DRAFT_573423 [Xylariaceae sp. FL0804]|nr:hypothetical protein GGR56DRAFT_573423 [Xylariaceae sp. FL0804]